MSSNASENDIDSDLSGESKFSRVAKWRSSIRSGIKKSKKTTQKLSKQLKNETQKALDTVQQKLPLKNFSSGTSLDNLNGNQRFQSDASSFNPRDVRDWNDNSERVFLQGAWNSQEQLDSHHCSPKKPDGIRKTHTLLASNVEHSAAMARAFVEGPQDSPMSSPRAGSERSNLSAFDADTMYDTARSQAFENNRRPAPQDVTLPNSEEDAFFPPPQTAPPPPTSPISAPTSPQNRSTPPPVPVRRCTSALSNSQPTRGHAPTRSASFRPTPPPPPPPIAEQHTTFTNPLIPEDSRPLEPPQTPVIRNYESARSGFETVDRRQFDTIDMRRQWSINHNYEEQLEHDLDTTLETSTEVWGEVDNEDSFDDESAEEYQVEEDFHEEKRDHFSKESNQYRKGDWSGLGYIELGRVSDATYLVDECKGHLMVGDQCLYVEYADTSNIKAPQDPNYHTGHSYGGPNYHKNFPTEPTDTMIVRNLDLESTEDSIRAAFQYITKKPILDIRLAKDKFTGNSRGFSFISWSSIDDCKQVLDYLQNATPKFKIDDRVVILDYANGLPGKTQDLKQQAANDAIAAATAIKTSWTDPNQLVGGAAALLKQTANQQGIAPHLTPHLYPKLPAEIGLKAPPLGMIPPIPPDQIPPQRDASGRYRKYQNPDFSMFQWMATHQMYYDPRTGLMWCVKKMQFYNQYTQQYLDWDPTQDTFVPIDHINIDAVVDQPATTGAFKTKEKKKLTQATDVQKQMESWMRQQKKSKAKPMSQAEADAIRRSKKEAHSNKFSAAGFGMSFNSSPMVQRAKSLVTQGAIDMEEENGPPAPPKMDDMFEDVPAPPPPQMPVVPAWTGNAD
ncbi:unnamed protein product [Oikopleura dioica]|uniref:RRM domain-containing protein n=1 Tax=Oikopleura dioica TaxID=34765 RepID=E4WQ56_OIKDI|nr:unnamed protein product [Oikopleura dioica]